MTAKGAPDAHLARAMMAARNNADLYALIFDAHGVPYRRTPAAFVAGDRPPPLFSDLVTLDPVLTDDALADFDAATRRSAGRAGMKDSFCAAPLARLGLKVLFDAKWIWHAPQIAALPRGWHRITTPAALMRWEQAWHTGAPFDQPQFPPSLLARSECVFLGYGTGDTITAGALLNHSADCVGLSNTFGNRPVAEIRDAALSVANDKPLVGYETRDDLTEFQNAGFFCVGDLRILTPDTTKEPTHAP